MLGARLGLRPRPQRGCRDQARPHETSLFPGGRQRDGDWGLSSQWWFPGTLGVLRMFVVARNGSWMGELMEAGYCSPSQRQSSLPLLCLGAWQERLSNRGLAQDPARQGPLNV